MKKIQLYKKGTVLYSDRLQKLDIAVVDNKIFAIADSIAYEGKGFQCNNATEAIDQAVFHDVFKLQNFQIETIDCTDKIILPALFDIHTHGAVGFDFNTADSFGMTKILDFFKLHGVGYVLPTVMTDSMEQMKNQLATIASLSTSRSEICGIHLEGPFLAEEYCGAMPKHFLQKPDVKVFEQLQNWAEGKIKLVTLSPELPNADKLTSYLTAKGVAVSLGHSGATFKQTMQCIDKGAKSFTHTFNRMKGSTQHEPNILGCAMLSDCFCEIIADGKHVNSNMVKLLHKTKGIDKIVAVSDSMMATGMPDGQYTLGVNEVTVVEGDAKITGTDTRAGSTLTADKAVENVAKFCDIEFVQAVKAMTINPAKILNMQDKQGTIQVGKQANFWLKNHKDNCF